MQTVKFSCDKCGKPMQVSTDYAGKKVLCPHCKQVVVAPAPVPVPAAAPSAPPAPSGPVEPVFRIPSRRDDEGSIFEANEEGDDLFDAEPKATLELPPAPAGFPNMQIPPSPSASAPVDATVTLPGSVPHIPQQQTNGDETMPLTTDLINQVAPAPSVPAVGEIEPTAAKRLAQQRAQQESMLTYYILAFLIPYAILLTIIVAFLLLAPKKPSSPLDILPDLPNDRGGTFKRVDDSKPLPSHLRVKLNQTLEIGELKVTPISIEQRRVTFSYENGVHPDQDSTDDALAVYLEVENTSKDLLFGPNDLFFNRKCTNDTAADRPYTSLEVGKKRFFGGPCKYVPKKADRPGWRGHDPREFIKGSEYNTDLMPGKKLVMLVCTDPSNPEILQSLAGHNGPLVYRIQLRRGLYREGSKEGTVTTVIGVEFSKNEIQSK